MKAFFAAMLALAVCVPSLRAQGPEADYANIYAEIVQADALKDKGNWHAAHAKYAEARTALKNLRTDNPDFNAKAVKYRLNYLAERLAETAGPPAKTASEGENSAAGTPTQSSEPVEMKLKWEVGKRYEQRMEMTQASAVTLPGSAKPVQQETKQTQDYAVTVQKERDGGGRELEVEVLGMKLTTKAAGNTVLDFDSAKSNDAGNPAAPMLRKMVGMRLKLLTDGSGKIESVEGLQEAVDRITGGASAMEKGMIQGMMSEDNIKEMYSAALGLPDKPVKPGDSWPLKIEVALGPLGAVVMNSQYTFKGLDQHNAHKCALLEFTGTLSAADTGAADNPMSIQGGKTSGKIWFDPALGMEIDRLAQESMTVKINAQGHALTTKVNAQSENKLVKITDAKEASAQ
jgi:hypothetical protein